MNKRSNNFRDNFVFFHYWHLFLFSNARGNYGFQAILIKLEWGHLSHLPQTHI